jgi:hypothetical protein
MKPWILLVIAGAAVLASGRVRTVSAQARPDTTGLARAVGTFVADSVVPRVSRQGPVYLAEPASAFDSAVAVVIRRVSPRTATFPSPARPPAYEWIRTRGYSLRGDSVAVMVEIGSHSDTNDPITTYIEENLYLFVRDGRGWRFVRREFVRGMDLGPVRG